MAERYEQPSARRAETYSDALGASHAALAPALFIGLTTIEGHFVTPKIVGMRLALNPLAVFLCLAFWTWLWGPVGAFLSVPFLILGLVIGNHMTIKTETDLPG